METSSPPSVVHSLPSSGNYGDLANFNQATADFDRTLDKYNNVMAVGYS